MSKVDWDYISQHPIEDWRDYYTLTCPICCGSDSIRDLLHEVLTWAALDSEKKHAKDGSKWEKGCYHSLETELAMHVLNSVKLVEHGTGIGWAWATEDGKKLLSLIEEFRKRELKGEK